MHWLTKSAYQELRSMFSDNAQIEEKLSEFK